MRALVVIPTYNEAATIRGIVTGVLGADRRVEALVVDDASPDGTGAIAEALAADEPRAHVLHRPGKAGLGSAYRDGFAWGQDRALDAFVEMDADGSHDPADVPRLLDGLDGADLVIGSRYVPGGNVLNWSAGRLALSRAGNRYVRVCTGLPVADATSGFRAYRAVVLGHLDLGTVRSEGYSFQVEMALRIWRLGFRVVEIPIRFCEREEGSSKMSGAIVAEAVWRVTRWAIDGPRHARPAHPASVARR